MASVIQARKCAWHFCLDFLVVDDGALADDLCPKLAARLEAAQITWHYSNKRDRAGLLQSRIEAVKLARHDWLLFVDDDVEIAPDYLVRLRDVVGAHPDLSGVGGVDILSRQRGFWTLAGCLLLGLEPFRPGRHSFAGFPCNMSRIRNAKRAFSTQRLYGCNMAFRRSALANLCMLPGFNGYSLGEDAYLSFVALESGRLLIEPALLVKHHHAPAARDSAFEIGRMSVLNHWTLLCLYSRPGWRLPRLALSLPALLTMSAARAFGWGRSGASSPGLAFARGQLSALGSLLRTLSRGR